MKRFLSCVVAVCILVMSLMPTVVFATEAQSGTCGDDLIWTLDDDGTLTISGTGDMLDYTYLTLPWYSSKDNIKAVIIEPGVTRIGDYAFYGCTCLNGIVIPDSVTNIGNYVFQNCTNLAEVNIPSSVTTIGSGVFYNCKSITNITVPDGVTGISFRMFDGCSGLTDITLSDNIKFIETFAFSGCTSLEQISLPDGVISIQDDAFGACMKLERIILPSSIDSIGEFAFDGCDSLAEVYYRGTEEDWAEIIFETGNSYLTDATIYYQYVEVEGIKLDQSSVAINSGEEKQLIATVLPDDATIRNVMWSSSDDFVATVDENGKVTAVDAGTAIITATTEEGGYSASCEMTVIVPVTGVSLEKEKTVIKVGESEQLTVIISPEYSTNQKVTWSSSNESVATVDENGKVTAVGIGEATITATTEDSGYSASCDVLTADVCGENVIWTLDDAGTLTISGAGAMADYSELSLSAPWSLLTSDIKAVVIADGVTHIGQQAFLECESLERITIPDSVISIGSDAFTACTSLTDVTIPDSVTSIGEYAFFRCCNLENITISGNVMSIEKGTFKGCTSLTDVAIPNSVTHIGQQAFLGCESLERITIPDSVISIDNDAFNWCTNLTSIVIPDSVISIGEWTFIGCTSLERIDVEKNNTKYSSADGILFDKDKTTLIAYPAGKGQAEYEIPDSVTRIGAYAFNWCKSLTNITIPDSVTSIGDCAFEQCTGITIHGYARSCAEEYANGNGINFAVIQVDVESVSLDKTKLSLYIGESETLLATVNPPLATNLKVFWSSTDAEIASVDENGKVTALVAGTAVIAVRSEDGNKLASCTVTVTAPTEVTSLTLDKSKMYLVPRESAKLEVTIEPADATYKEVLWESSDENIATVDENGYVTAVGVGSAVITVTSERYGKMAECSVIVQDEYVATGMVFDKSDLSLDCGENAYLNVVFIPEHTTNKTILWMSTDESVVIVDENGKVTAVGAGSASVIAMSVSGNKSARCMVTVTEPIIPGDVTGDDVVDFVDAMLVLKHDAVLELLSGDALAAADVNGDGYVDFADAILILKYDAELIEEF